jgi:hypothetical protein
MPIIPLSRKSGREIDEEGMGQVKKNFRHENVHCGYRGNPALKSIGEGPRSGTESQTGRIKLSVWITAGAQWSSWIKAGSMRPRSPDEVGVKKNRLRGPLD